MNEICFNQHTTQQLTTHWSTHAYHWVRVRGPPSGWTGRDCGHRPNPRRGRTTARRPLAAGDPCVSGGTKVKSTAALTVVAFMKINIIQMKWNGGLINIWRKGIRIGPSLWYLMIASSNHFRCGGWCWSWSCSVFLFDLCPVLKGVLIKYQLIWSRYISCLLWAHFWLGFDKAFILGSKLLADGFDTALALVGFVFLWVHDYSIKEEIFQKIFKHPSKYYCVLWQYSNNYEKKIFLYYSA